MPPYLVSATEPEDDANWNALASVMHYALGELLWSMAPTTRTPPTPAEVRAARHAASHTQVAAATTLYSHPRTWQDWESGRRTMSPAMLELYEIKTGRHPTYGPK